MPRRRKEEIHSDSSSVCDSKSGKVTKPIQRNAANARERARMRVLSKAFSKLKTTLPWVPPDTKLSKLDTLRLASSYIAHLQQILDTEDAEAQQQLIHPLNLEEQTAADVMSMSTACPLLSTEWTPPDRRPQEDIKVRRQAVQDNRRRPTSNAARERSRVKTLRSAFFNLQLSLPAVPPDTKLSKLDVLLLATAYITHLRNSLDAGQETGYHHQELREQRATAPRGEARLGETVCDRRVPDNTRHPVKKWPLRARLYQGILDSAHLTRARDNKHWKSSRPRVSQ